MRNPYKPLMANSEEKCHNGTKHISKHLIFWNTKIGSLCYFLSLALTWLLTTYLMYSNAKFFIQSYSTGAIKETEKTKLKLCGGVKLAVKFDVEARIFPDTEKEWTMEKGENYLP